MNSNLNFIFDIDGLATLPDFRTIVDSASNKGNVLFWTFNILEQAQKILSKNGVQGFDDRIFSQDHSKYLAHAATQDPLRNTDLAYIQRLLASWGFPNDRPQLGNFVSTAKNWVITQAQSHTLFKFPPLLGEGPHLLVESDMTYGSRDGIQRDMDFVTFNTDSANSLGYSLLFVPEHPVAFDPKSRSTPEMVSARLLEEVLQWNGSHIVKDLGSEMSVYEGNQPSSHERRLW